MNDVNTEAAEGNEGTEAAATGTAPEAESTETAAEGEAKSTQRRKPIWVCVPVAWEEIADVNDAGDLVAVKQPTAYSITQCEPKKKVVLACLAQKGIDITNIDTVIMFRADPMDFTPNNQLDIRW